MSSLPQPPGAAIADHASPEAEHAAASLRLTHPNPIHATSLSRQQIIQATTICFRQEGYDGTTIRRIAKELNCAVGSIYRYFADKRELLSAVTQQAFEPLAQAAQAGQPIEESISEYRRVALADPVSYRLMFWLASLPGAPADSLTPGASAAGLPQVIDRIVQNWASQMESREQAYNTWAYLHGVVTWPTASWPATAKPAASLRLAQPVKIEIPREPEPAVAPESAEDMTLL